MTGDTSGSMRVCLAGALLVLCFVVVVGGVGCGGSTGVNATRKGSTTDLKTTALPRSDARALTVSFRAIPRLTVPYYKTSGVYPYVSRAGMDLRAVNTTLRNAVLKDQHWFAIEARADEKQGTGGYLPGEYGIYETYPRYPPEPHLISASTVEVSALIPLVSLYPKGNDGEEWISVTVLVPSGKTVTISDLFKEPRLGIAALARAWKEQLRLHQHLIWKYWAPESPTPQNYRDFALTPKGLAVGYVGGGACGRFFAIVPYSILSRYLGPLGKILVAGVRQPGSASRSARAR